MRILGVTNSLPPLNYGYGVICRDVMAELARRGHDVEVHAADGGESDALFETRIDLSTVPGGWRRPCPGLAAERRNSRAIAAAMEARPDAVLVWHMRGVGKGPLSRAEALSIPVLYMLGDLWLVYEKPGPPPLWRFWQEAERRPGYRRVRDSARRAIGVDPYPSIGDEGIVCFASAWLRDRYAELGFRPRHGLVVANGIRLEEFSAVPRKRDGVLRVVFVGRLDPTKGADTVIEAIAAGPKQTHLHLVGGSESQDLERLHRMTADLGLSERVQFLGVRNRGEVIKCLQRADVFAMPGRIEEGFGLVYLEAMAAGAAVVGSALGGATELCRNGSNALIVPPGHPGALADALAALQDPRLRDKLAAEGRRTAERYSLGTMVDRIEALVAGAACEAKRRQSRCATTLR